MLVIVYFCVQLRSDQLRLRHIEQHLRQCSLVNTGDPSFSVEYGVNNLSVLNEAPRFDLCTCFPHDIMHVIMEGVLPRHVKALIRYCICEKHFLTLNQLNRNIANFDYGYSEKVNQPAHLTGIISLQMTRKFFSQVRHLVCTPILVCIVPIIRFMIHCLVLGKLYKTVLVQTTCASHTHTLAFPMT